MAIVISGLISGDSRETLILSPDEGLFYPTPIDDSWDNINLVVAWSRSYDRTPCSFVISGIQYTTSGCSGSFTGNGSFSTISNGFLGFKSETVGVSQFDYYNSLATGIFAGYIPGTFGVFSGNSTSSSSAQSLNIYNLNQSLDTGFATYQGINFSFTNKNQIGQRLIINSYYLNNVTPSISGMEDFIKSPSNLVNVYAGYFTTGFASNGGPLKFPTNFYMDFMQTSSQGAFSSDWIKIYGTVIRE